MQKVKVDGTQSNGLQQSSVNQNQTKLAVDLETQDAVETDRLVKVDDGSGDDDAGECEISHGHDGSVAPPVSQKAATADSSDNSDGVDDSDFNEDTCDLLEYPPLPDLMQIPDCAARYAISRQAFYKRLNYLGYKPEMIGGKAFLSKEQMETLDRLALWIRENGTMNGFLGESALVVSQGNSVQKKSNDAVKSSSAVPRTGKASRDRQLSDAQIVAKRAELRAAQMLIGEDVAVNYLLENPDRISDEVMDEVLNFREGMQASMIDSSVGKPFDVDTFATDILNCFAQAG